MQDGLTAPLHWEAKKWDAGFHRTSGQAVFESFHQDAVVRGYTPADKGDDWLKQDFETVDDGIYGGSAFNHFGHFIVESIGRLWAVNREEFAHLPIFFHAPWGAPDLEAETSTIKSMLQLLSIDVARVRFIKRPLRFKRIVIPEQLYGFHCIAEPKIEFIDFLRGAQAKIEAAISQRDDRFENVLVSRSRWQDKFPKKGMVLGLAEFDAFMAGEGWKVIQPEEHSFLEQLSIYASAKRLVFVEGSAQHSCVMLPDVKAEIAIVMRRPDEWSAQRSASQFSGMNKQVTTIQKIDSSLWFGMPPWSGLLDVDFAYASKRLQDLGFIDKSFTHWPETKTPLRRAAVAKYVAAIADDEKFIDFMASLPSHQYVW
ncbi:glycosyltransferase 61 family protein [Rhizobium sp.]